MGKGMTTVNGTGDFPADGQAHFCVLEFTSVTIPGDERSRTHPGHGYPESTERYSTLHRFDSQGDLETWLLRNEHRNFVVLSASRLKTSKTISVKVEG